MVYLTTSLWFEPWWRSTCLAATKNALIIAQAGLSSEATVNSLINSGAWILPIPSNRIHHLDSTLVYWTQNFDFPGFDLTTTDVILWDGLPIHKVKTRNIWNSLRTPSMLTGWSKFIWHRLKILRYAYHAWILCHGRLPTFNRLAYLGLEVSQFCLFCVGGVETDSHLFVTCAYSSFILSKLFGLLKAQFAGTNWVAVLHSLGGISDHMLRNVSLLAAQIYSYHMWRNRNASLHGKASSGPTNLIKGIMIDLKSKLCNTEWFLKHANLELYRWLII